MSHLEPLMQRNFLEYASYVVVDRAIPELRDGCKPVQRRILHTLFSMDDGKFHKVANVIGESMKLHPHGDASIGSALVVLANKEYFIEKQGNFGNVITGHNAAAARYIECRLTPLAKETLFNKALTDWQKSYDGRKDEPVALPAKIPVILMIGAEGIAVGMATKILPHNFGELLQAQIAILEKREFNLVPDFIQGGLIDPAEYDDGRGKVKVRARIEVEGDKRIVIREIPFSTTTESLINSIETATQKGKLKVSSINDFTSEDVEIELTLPRGVYAEEVVQQLYAYTDCEVSVSSNIITIDGRSPRELSVSELLQSLTVQLKAQIKRELEWELEQLEAKQHWMTLEQLFIENKVYKPLEQVKTEDGLRKTVYKGMAPFEEQFVRPMDDEDVKRLLGLAIRRISRFDIDKHRKDLGDILKGIRGVKSKLRNLTKTTIDYLDKLHKKYAATYPRRTEISEFRQVDKRQVARQNLKVGYDKKTGFLGTSVKGKDVQLTVSEYDFILAIHKDGSYKIMPVEEKILLPPRVIYLDVFDPEQGKEFVVLYRDSKKIAWGKRIKIHKFIRNKEYRLIKDPKGKVEHLLKGDDKRTIRCELMPAPRQRTKEAKFDLKTLEETSATARGTRLAPKPVKKINLR